MSSLTEQYKNLIALSRLYLSQEFSNPERIACEADSFAFYKAYGFELRNRTTPSPRPAPTPVIVQDNAAPRPLAPPKTPTAPIKSEAKPLPPQPAKKATSPSISREPPPAEKTPPSSSSSAFVLQPLGKPVELPQEEWRQLLTTNFPGMPLSTAVPPDDVAKEQKNTDPASLRVLILSTEQTPEKVQFLQKLTQAIHERLPTAKIVHVVDAQKEGWNKSLQSPSIRLVIGSAQLIESCPELEKEGILKIEGSQRYLKNYPLLLLDPIDLYLQNADAKRALWNKLRSDLKI